MATDHEVARLLRRSIRELLTEPDGDYEIASLVAAVADTPALVEVAHAELAPRTGHLDIHVSGSPGAPHRTVAKSFGKFVAAIADSAKWTMKDISGIAKAPDELLVEPGPGSVRAIFIAPPRHSSDVMQVPESLDETIPEDDSYSESLWRLATVLANAGPTEDGSAVADGALAALPGQARFELRKAMDEVVSEGWDLWGDFTQRGRQPTELHLSNESARFLRDVLVDRSVSRSPWETTGFLDGHTWSTNTMRFIAANQASSITATFENPKVQLEVARLDVQPDQYVRAQFMVTTTTSPARPHGVRSYSIVSVAIVPRESEPVTLDL